MLLALGVALTPSLASLHTHDVPADPHPGIGIGHAPHHGHADRDRLPHPEDHHPAKDTQAACGLCHLLSQARADLSTPVAAVASLTFAGYRSHLPPDSPVRALRALSDAPPRGPPVL